uniref:Putative peptidase C1A, papain C-terminal n=1 Tax=Helianthus annuus TaxID=4232 RepID=A0A251S276_HELAN
MLPASPPDSKSAATYPSSGDPTPAASSSVQSSLPQHQQYNGSFLRCYTCWAFFATCTVEYLHFLETGKLSLSRSRSYSIAIELTIMVVDTAAYMFMVENGGLNSDADYPYMAKDGVCDKSKVSSFFKIQTTRNK